MADEFFSRDWEGDAAYAAFRARFELADDSREWALREKYWRRDHPDFRMDAARKKEAAAAAGSGGGATGSASSSSSSSSSASSSSSSSSGSSSSSSSSSTSSRSSSSSSSGSGAGSSGPSRYVVLAGLLCHTLVLLSAVMYMVPLIGTSGGAFRVLLLAATASYALSVQQTLAPLRGSVQGGWREWAARATPLGSTHFLLLALQLLAGAEPSLVFVLPFVIYAALQLAVLASPTGPVVRLLPPDRRSQIVALTAQPTATVLAKQADLCGFASRFELAGIFTSLLSGQLMVAVGYYVFLSMRYQFDPTTRQTITTFTAAADGIFHHPRSPAIVRTGYDTVKGLLAKYAAVQPRR